MVNARGLNKKAKTFRLMVENGTLKSISERDILYTGSSRFIGSEALVTKVNGQRIETLTRERCSGKSMTHPTPRIIRTAYTLDEIGKIIEEEKIGDYIEGTPEYKKANKELGEVDLSPINKMHVKGKC